MHYGSENFVIVFDNCRIYTANYVKQLLTNIKHVFTPPYRTEFNAIEHMFGWLKRKLATKKPMLFYHLFIRLT